MTNRNYIETKLYLKELYSRKSHLSYELKSHPEMFTNVMSLTSFLPEDRKLCERVFCILNDIKSIPVCPICNKNPLKFISLKRGYAQHCSSTCSRKDKLVVEKQRNTCNILYDSPIPGHSEHANNKRIQTNRKHWGVDNAFQDKEIQERIKQTMLERHGVEYAQQSKSIQAKSIETCRKHFGVDHPTQSCEIIERTKQTSRQKYNTDFPCQSEQVKQKIVETNLKNHGVKCIFQSKEFQDATKVRNLELYNATNPFQSEIIKKKIVETNNKIFGVDYPMQSEEIREKAQQTNIEKYGVPHYSQSAEYAKKCHRRYSNPKYPDVTFATSWEFKVYDFLTENHIDFEYQPSISIHYECEGTHHTYHPDFLVNGRLFEVKGDQFFRINEETGKEEMYLTWKGNLSDEEYEWKCKVMESKHQCMIANNVIILRKKDIDNLEQVFVHNHPTSE